MERIPGTGELYRHFKNKLYQVIAVANHSETGEKLVIYQALYGDYQVYARPLEMFVSEVDHVKYPDVTQKYRFERVERESLVVSGASPRMEKTPILEMEQTPSEFSQQSQATVRTVETEPAKQPYAAVQEEGVNPKLMAFFDVETMEEKYNILVSMRDEVDDHLINSMAVVMDVVIPEGEVSDRYEQLKRCIRTKQRYETDRLR